MNYTANFAFRVFAILKYRTYNFYRECFQQQHLLLIRCLSVRHIFSFNMRCVSATTRKHVFTNMSIYILRGRNI